MRVLQNATWKAPKSNESRRLLFCGIAQIVYVVSAHFMAMTGGELRKRLSEENVLICKVSNNSSAIRLQNTSTKYSFRAKQVHAIPDCNGILIFVNFLFFDFFIFLPIFCCFTVLMLPIFFANFIPFLFRFALTFSGTSQVPYPEEAPKMGLSDLCLTKVI